MLHIGGQGGDPLEGFLTSTPPSATLPTYDVTSLSVPEQLGALLALLQHFQGLLELGLSVLLLGFIGGGDDDGCAVEQVEHDGFDEDEEEDETEAGAGLSA